MKSGGHILVIDDNLQNRELAAANLVSVGYSVTLAESGEAALRLFTERPPDLILLDVLMPGMDGFETCKSLRELPGGMDAAIVFVTALTDLGSHQRAMASGADDFLTKPINRTELLLRVRSLLWIKRLKAELREGYDLIRSQRDALLSVQQQREALTSLIVHDLKSPLTAILLLGSELAESSHGEDAQSARQIVDAASSMQRMVMNLLDISRSEDGMLLPQCCRVDLAQLARKVVASQAVRNVPQTLRVAGEAAVTVDADPELLRRVLENLIDNAKKYSPRIGTITVEIERVDEWWAEIRVQDEGAGIPPALREKIFEKYARLDPDISQHAGNSCGLGLTFCRLAAEAHSGRIWVDDGPEGGSCFHLRLPISAVRPAAIEEGRPQGT